MTDKKLCEHCGCPCDAEPAHNTARECIESLAAENAQLRKDLQRYDEKDRVKTNEINILVPENRRQWAELDQCATEALWVPESAESLPDAIRSWRETAVLLRDELKIQGGANETLKQQLAESHDDICENGHAEHKDCTEACSCVGSGKSKVERLQTRIWELEEQLEAERKGHAETKRELETNQHSKAECDAAFEVVTKALRAQHATGLAAAEERAFQAGFISGSLTCAANGYGTDISDMVRELARYRAQQSRATDTHQADVTREHAPEA